jgi:hypothetical protein
MQGKPKRVGRRSNWNKIGKHGNAYETTPEPSTRGVVDITLGRPSIVWPSRLA